MSEVTLLLRAQIDVQEIYARLAGNDPRSAERLDAALNAALHQLERFPRSAPVHVRRYRRLVLRPFPFAVLYVIEAPRVVVHTVVDSRQDPRSIARALGE